MPILESEEVVYQSKLEYVNLKSLKSELMESNEMDDSNDMILIETNNDDDSEIIIKKPKIKHSKAKPKQQAKLCK